MKATGLVRKVDGLGRVAIPVELRRKLGIKVKDGLEIYVDAENLVLSKYEPACLFCGNKNNMKHIGNRIVCHDCINRLVKE